MNKLWMLCFCMSLLLFGKDSEAASVSKIRGKLLRSLGCQNFSSVFFDSTYDLLRDGLGEEEFKKSLLTFDSLEGLEDIFAEQMGEASVFQKVALKLSIQDLWQAAMQGHEELTGKSFDSYELYKRLVGAELGDATTPERRHFNELLTKKLAHASLISAALSLPCKIVDSIRKEVKGLPHKGKSVAYGARRAFSIFYQSCSSLDHDTYGPDYPDLRGIKVIGQHPAGGNRRVIDDIGEVLKTHYYLENSYSSSCFDWRQSPPIYDFGGKPKATETDFNFFKNAGSGTSVLGVDCSAVVVTALGAVGRRPKKGLRFKPDFVNGIGSSMLKEPQANGLTCLKKASFSQSGYDLRPGDILAKRGHVVIVEGVGEDTWGVKTFSDVAQCTLANMSLSDFDFTILQSSPIKGAIGVNRVHATEYFDDENTMSPDLLRYAYNACHAHFGSPLRLSTNEVSVVQHSGTEECLESPVPFVNESCVDACDYGSY